MDHCNPEIQHTCVCLSQLFSKAAFQDDGVEVDVWPYLHRLLVNLRAGIPGKGGGCDASFIKSHQNCRRVSGKLNWHQVLEHLRRQMNLRTGLPAHRVSRSEAWKTVAASSLKKHLGLDERSMPQLLASQDVVLLQAPVKPPSWQVGLVMSLWYQRGKKVRPCHLPLAIERVRTIRVVLMKPVPGMDEGMFQADHTCMAVTCSPLRIAAMLNCDEKDPSAESFRCSLSDSSLKAVQSAHKLIWPKNLYSDEAAPCTTFAPPSPFRSPKTAKTSKMKKDQEECAEDDVKKDTVDKKKGKPDGKKVGPQTARSQLKEIRKAEKVEKKEKENKEICVSRFNCFEFLIC